MYKFKFGRHKGKNLIQIWSGSQRIPRDVLERFFLTYFSKNYPQVINNLKFLIPDGEAEVELFFPEIIDIRVIKDFELWLNRYSESINLYRIKRNPYSSLKQDTKDFLYHIEDHTYIIYAIENFSDFKLTHSELHELENTPINKLKEFHVSRCLNQNYGGYIISVYPIINNLYFTFTDEFKSLHAIDDVILNDATQNNSFDLIYDKYDGPLDGYGFAMDDDYIDDAFGGEPDAYWNID